jgi:DNA-binding NarL/FixJ family response regulator
MTTLAPVAAGPPSDRPRTAIRLLLGSESPVLRAGMHALLRGQESLEIVGAVQQLDRLPQHVADTAAHAALVAPAGGMAAALQLLGDNTLRCSCVLLVPPAASRAYGGALLRDQGVQCLPLTADPGRIVLALRRTMSTLRYGVAVERLSRGIGGRLTPREQEVVERLARGETNALIASDLGITEDTVKTHLTSIYRKLGVTNRTEAIATYLGAL